MFRFILVCITVIGFLILSIPVLVGEWIVGKFSPMKKDLSSLHLIQFMFRFILRITGITVTVIGEENIPTEEPVLYIGNHRSERRRRSSPGREGRFRASRLRGWRLERPQCEGFVSE